MAGTGGVRRGAGRKPKPIVEVKRNWAAAILPDDKEREYWREMLENPKTRQDALKLLSEHKHGKAPQSVQQITSGGLNVTVRFIGNRTPAETSDSVGPLG